MIKRRHLAVLLCASAALLFAACKSAPKTEPKEETPAPAQEEQKQEPVVEQPKEEPKQEAKTDYSEANAALLDKVSAARDAAIAAGAEAANPDGYKAAEVEYAAEKKADTDDSTADLSVALNDLIARYNALTAVAEAKAKKARIDSLGYADYDKADYDSASKALDELLAPTANIATGKDLYKKADTANRQFGNVLTTAFKTLAKNERTEAFKAKKQADEVKAAVSRKTEYDQGVDSFRTGDQDFVNGNPEKSISDYTASKDMFTKLYTEISEARAKAQAAIDAAKKRVADSNAVATEADTKVPLGDEKVKGIEDPDAKLLQDDDFSSNENAAVTVDETLEEGASEK